MRGIYGAARQVPNANMANDATPDKVKELEMLRHEYKAAMSVAIDPEEKWRLFRALREPSSCR